jgi:F-type H+-transporting ATPase subunit delta
MSTGKIAVRYAKALFLSAREQKVLDQVREDMEILLQSIEGMHEIGQLLESPIVDSGKKSAVLTELFKSSFHKLSLDFINLVALNKREEYLSGMARYFVSLYKNEKGIQVATISSAINLEKGSSNQIREMIKAAFKTEIELEQEIKKDLIGGFVLRVENRQLDASVKGKLARIKKELQE